MKRIMQLAGNVRVRLTLLAVAVVCLALPAASMAVETEGEKGVKEVATQVSTEGVTIILAVLTALIGLIAVTIILPKAIRWVKKFV